MSHSPCCSSCRICSTWAAAVSWPLSAGQQVFQQESISFHHAAKAMQSRPLEAAAVITRGKVQPGTSHQQYRASSADAGCPHLGGQPCSLPCSSHLWACWRPSPQHAGIAACREEDATALGLGSTRKAEDACAAHAPLAIAAWKGRGSLSVLVSKGMHLRSSMGYLLASGSGTLRSAQGCAISIQLHMALK